MFKHNGQNEGRIRRVRKMKADSSREDAEVDSRL